MICHDFLPNVFSIQPIQWIRHCFLFNTIARDIPTYRVLQTIQMKLILLCVLAQRVVLGSAKTALKFKYEISIG